LQLSFEEARNQTVNALLCCALTTFSSEPDRSGRSGRSDLSDRYDRSGRSDLSDRSDRSARSDRYDRSGRSDLSDRSDRSDLSDRSDRSNRSVSFENDAYDNDYDSCINQFLLAKEFGWNPGYLKDPSNGQQRKLSKTSMKRNSCLT
jgi:hypothetical protein